MKKNKKKLEADRLFAKKLEEDEMFETMNTMSDEELMEMCKEFAKNRGKKDFDIVGIKFGNKVRIFKDCKGLDKGEYQTLFEDDSGIELLGPPSPKLPTYDILIKKKKMN